MLLGSLCGFGPNESQACVRLYCISDFSATRTIEEMTDDHGVVYDWLLRGAI
jgi:hypothetical protein